MAPPVSMRVPFPQTPAVAYQKEERLHTCSRDGRLVTIEPSGPNKRTGFLVLFEMQRRREQGWPATENGDEVPDTEPSEKLPLLSSDVVETIPDAWQASKNKTIKYDPANGVNATTTMNKRQRMATPGLSHATRMTRAQAKLTYGVNMPTMNKRKRESTTPRSGTPNVLDDSEDGKCFLPRKPAIR
ncbi:MAG: hypothetical protein Q9208_004091 [Pyrenodesmia sp. 3 TL-2023]